jgi:hypothetical protein
MGDGAKSYKTFKKQSYHEVKGKAYAPGPAKNKYPDIDQFVFEVDMRRIYKFHTGLKRNKPLDMVDRGTLSKIEKAIKRQTIRISGIPLHFSSGDESSIIMLRGDTSRTGGE